MNHGQEILAVVRCFSSWVSDHSPCFFMGREPPACLGPCPIPVKINLYVLTLELYTQDMPTLNVSDLRAKLHEAVEAARSEAVFLQRHGRPAAVLVSPERYEELLAAFEEAEDIAAFDAAMSQEGSNIPWEQGKAELGWH